MTTRKLKSVEVLKAQCEAQGVKFEIVSGVTVPETVVVQMTKGIWRLRVFVEWCYWGALRHYGTASGWRPVGSVDYEAIENFLYEPEAPESQPVSWAVTAGGSLGSGHAPKRPIRACRRSSPVSGGGEPNDDAG